MAKKVTISINEFEKAINKEYENTTTVEYGDLKILVTRTLGLGEMMEFINIIVDKSFDTNTREYSPILKEFVTKCLMITFYTNISIPSDYNKMCDFVYKSSIIDLIKEEINLNQYYDIVDAADKIINYRVSTSVEEIKNGLDEMSKLVPTLNSMFEKFDADEFQTIAKAISEKGINEEAIARAITRERFGE